MPIDFAIRYEGGRAHASTRAEILAAPPSGFLWIDIVDPTVGELSELADRFGLHPVAIDDALAAGQLPKADPTGENSLFVVTRTARRDDGRVEFGQIAVFVGRDHNISVSRDGAPARTELRTTLEQLPEMLEMGVDYILHGILGFATGSFIEVIDRLDDEVGDLEATIPVAALDTSRIAHLLLLRRHVKRMERMLKPMEEMGRKLAAGELPCIRPDLAIYCRDVVDRVQRAQSICASVHDGLASVFEYSALLEQQRTGAVTRQLAAWAAILAVPTAIAGIYGMNFRAMPELAWQYGYPVIMAAMLLLSLLLYWRFRRLDWV